VAGVDRRQFLVHNLAGAGVWAVVMFGGGYWLGAVPVVAGNLGLILLAILVISALPALAAILRARRPAAGGSHRAAGVLDATVE